MPEDPNRETRHYEHQYLRTEVEVNKKFVFERALVISGAVFAASLLGDETKGLELLGVPAIGALAYNLWTARGRMTSSARIIGYMQHFHEPDSHPGWIGWEKALSLYREWSAVGLTSMKEQLEKDKNEIHPGDLQTFYKPIHTIHVAMALIIAAFMSLRAWLFGSMPVNFLIDNGRYVPLWLTVVLNVLALIVFGWVALRCRPRNLNNGIEKQYLEWKAVFEWQRKGKPEDSTDT